MNEGLKFLKETLKSKKEAYNKTVGYLDGNLYTEIELLEDLIYKFKKKIEK